MNALDVAIVASVAWLTAHCGVIAGRHLHTPSDDLNLNELNIALFGTIVTAISFFIAPVIALTAIAYHVYNKL